VVVNPEGKGPEGKPRYRFEGNIKMDLRRIGWKVWTGLIWLRRDQWRARVNTLMNLRVPQVFK
jgi:hypothetical protein